jgi:hypothetical protein
MRVDPGGSTDIIHKRIFNGMNRRRTAGFDSVSLAFLKQASISWVSAGFRIREIGGAARGRFTYEVH